MSLHEHGIEVVLKNGVLYITGPRTTPILFNDRPMLPERDAPKAPGAQFWNADGTQTSERPEDLRGE